MTPRGRLGFPWRPAPSRRTSHDQCAAIRTLSVPSWGARDGHHGPIRQRSRYSRSSRISVPGRALGVSSNPETEIWRERRSPLPQPLHGCRAGVVRPHPGGRQASAKAFSNSGSCYAERFLPEQARLRCGDRAERAPRRWAHRRNAAGRGSLEAFAIRSEWRHVASARRGRRFPGSMAEAVLPAVGGTVRPVKTERMRRARAESAGGAAWRPGCYVWPLSRWCPAFPSGRNPVGTLAHSAAGSFERGSRSARTGLGSHARMADDTRKRPSGRIRCRRRKPSMKTWDRGRCRRHEDVTVPTTCEVEVGGAGVFPFVLPTMSRLFRRGDPQVRVSIRFARSAPGPGSSRRLLRSSPASSSSRSAARKVGWLVPHAAGVSALPVRRGVPGRSFPLRSDSRIVRRSGSVAPRAGMDEFSWDRGSGARRRIPLRACLSVAEGGLLRVRGSNGLDEMAADGSFCAVDAVRALAKTGVPGTGRSGGVHDRAPGSRVGVSLHLFRRDAKRLRCIGPWRACPRECNRVGGDP
jgi:hypothetical protein